MGITYYSKQSDKTMGMLINQYSSSFLTMINLNLNGMLLC